MATEAQIWDALGEVIIKFPFAALTLANLVSHMAGPASQIDGSMVAAFLGDVFALVMATEAQVLAFAPRSGLQ
jgi:hypothetical protein